MGGYSLKHQKAKNLWPKAPSLSLSLLLVAQLTVELLHFLLFLSTPSSHPPSLCFRSLHSLRWKKKVPPGFLALKGQKQTGSWQASNSLGSGYKGEGGDRTGQGKGKGSRKESGRQKRMGEGQGKLLCATFFEAHTEKSSRYGWTELYYHYINLRQQASKTKSEVLGDRSRERTWEKQRASEKVSGWRGDRRTTLWEFSSTMSAEVWCMEKKTTHVQKFYPGYVCLKIKAGDLMVVRAAHSNTTKPLLSYIHYKMQLRHNLYSVKYLPQVLQILWICPSMLS